MGSQVTVLEESVFSMGLKDDGVTQVKVPLFS